MKKIRVMSIFGTRPEAIKMAPLIKELESRKEIESIVMTQYQKAIKILTDATAKLHETAKLLFEKEKISGDEFRTLMEN